VLLGPKGLGEWQHREIQLRFDRQPSAAMSAQLAEIAQAARR
jgi:hypothetical protein